MRRLADVGSYLETRNPAAAARMVGAIANAVDRLASEPGRGRPGRIPGTRELVVVGTPYLVACRINREIIEVLTIQHGAQRWPQSL